MIFNIVIILEISLTVKLNNFLCATEYWQMLVGLTLLKELSFEGTGLGMENH